MPFEAEVLKDSTSQNAAPAVEVAETSRGILNIEEDPNVNIETGNSDDGAGIPPSTLPRRTVWQLYTSHAVSTWNSRSFEFGSVLFLASIYPDTLLYLSIYAMVRSASAILFSSYVGSLIDQRSRLTVVRLSIGLARIAVFSSSIGLWVLWHFTSMSWPGNQAIFAGLTLLACVEKLAFVANQVSVERDWVVVMAGDNEAQLQKINAEMRRIDLICKLVGPLVIALIDGASTTVALWFMFGSNILSLPIELVAIGRVYRKVPALRRERIKSQSTASTGFTALFEDLFRRFSVLKRTYKHYFQHPAFLPSFALSLLYLTVLSFGGQMVTYLLSAGFNAFIIALVRSLSVIFEISATWIAPRVMTWITPTRAGMWFLSWQILWLVATLVFFWTEQNAIVSASVLSAGTILSRIGLWGYDLSAQIIIQNEVQGDARGSFSTTEAAFQNLFELISYALTIAFSSPDQFKYPVLVSVAAVGLSGALYAHFLRKRRGHLLHVPFVALKMPWNHHSPAANDVAL